MLIRQAHQELEWCLESDKQPFPFISISSDDLRELIHVNVVRAFMGNRVLADFSFGAISHEVAQLRLYALPAHAPRRCTHPTHWYVLSTFPHNHPFMSSHSSNFALSVYLELDMEIPSPKALDEVAELIWASHILSYWNPYTTPMSDKLLPLKDTPSVDQETDDDEEYDDSPDIDKASIDAATLPIGDEILREKFLNSISELLAHTKGGNHVTAATLREKEDSIEIDIARNTGFRCDDQKYLSSLAHFLSRRGERKYKTTQRYVLL